jgi:hypothetical protein
MAALGRDLHLVLNAKAGQADQRPRSLRKLEKAGAHLYLVPHRFRHQFMVVCDRWGTPVRAWTGSGSWTTESLCLRNSHALLVDSVPLARAYLDRWEYLRDSADPARPSRRRRPGRPGQILLDQTAITLWNTPAASAADLRDVTRLIRGAREGILFLMGGYPGANPVLDEILQVGREDLFVRGITSTVRGRGKPYITFYDPFTESRGRMAAESPIDSNLIVIDPFGPHPVVIGGSHDFGLKTSAKENSDLLIIEDAPGLATECAVHLIRLFDHNRFRSIASQLTGRSMFMGLKQDDAWQQKYFAKVKHSEFNFFFGSLWPGMD